MSWLPITHGARDPPVTASAESIAVRNSAARQPARISWKLKTCGRPPDWRYGASVSGTSYQTSPTAVRGPGKPSAG
jgi:hypothetical protein